MEALPRLDVTQWALPFPSHESITENDIMTLFHDLILT